MILTRNQAELRLVTKIARLYHEDGLTQTEIADMLGVTQVAVSRFLKTAEKFRIVSTTVITPPGIFTEMEHMLQNKFGIRQAIIAEASRDDKESILHAIGSSAAYFMESTIKSGDIVGISSWSASLLAMVDYVRPVRKVTECAIVQLQGRIGNPSAEKHAHHLVTRLARLVRGEAVLHPAPGIVGSAEIAQIYKKDPAVLQATHWYGKVTLALLGVGASQPADLLMSDDHGYTAQDVQELRAKGAVGDILCRFFDIEGNLVESELRNRTLSMNLAELRNIKHSVGIAGGESKVQPLIGAMRGHYINVLITDQFTGEKLLNF